MRGEELPENYYRNMLPSRDDTVRIYRNISDSGIAFDKLYMKFCPALNYCKFCVAVEALRQLGIVTISFADFTVKKTVTDKKSDLASAPVLVALREKIKN